MLGLGFGPGFLAYRWQLPSQTSLHWFCQAIPSPSIFVTTIRQALKMLFEKGAVPVSGVGGPGWIPVGRGFAHTLDTQVLLCVPGALQSHTANPFVHPACPGIVRFSPGSLGWEGCLRFYCWSQRSETHFHR